MDEPNDEAVARARAEVLDAFERAAEVWGFKRSYGRLYGILFFADDPLSLSELAERSGYAKSTVSTAMSAMERYHLVQRRSIPGEGKTAFFEAERDFWYVFQQFLTQEVSREITVMLRALESAEAHLEDADSEQASEDLAKVRQLKTMYDRSERLVGLLERESIDRLSGLVSRLRSDE
jgi:DNA-binding transcriptional regulator GbsR (MarR family)